MTNNVYTKKDIEKQANDAIFACQRLHNIRSLGIWRLVQDTATEALSKYPADIRMNQSEYDEACRDVLGAIYAAAAND